MSDLERFAAGVLAAWRARGESGGGPIGVGTLLDEVFPYRAARRVLGIDVSEDYEAIVLRLIAEEENLATTAPVDAADMARTTMASKLPDLDVLQLLRSATITIPGRVIARLGEVELPRPKGKGRSRWARDAAETPGGSERAPAPDLPVPAVSVEEDVSESSVDEPPAPAAPTAAVTTPPGGEVPMTVEHCWSCGEGFPAGREIRFCPFCGADQRTPACGACGATVERRWKFCPDCGQTLWSKVDG